MNRGWMARALHAHSPRHVHPFESATRHEPLPSRAHHRANRAIRPVPATGCAPRRIGPRRAGCGRTRSPASRVGLHTFSLRRLGSGLSPNLSAQPSPYCAHPGAWRRIRTQALRFARLRVRRARSARSRTAGATAGAGCFGFAHRRWRAHASGRARHRMVRGAWAAFAGAGRSAVSARTGCPTRSARGALCPRYALGTGPASGIGRWKPQRQSRRSRDRAYRGGGLLASRNRRRERACGRH